MMKSRLPRSVRFSAEAAQSARRQTPLLAAKNGRGGALGVTAVKAPMPLVSLQDPGCRDLLIAQLIYELSRRYSKSAWHEQSGSYQRRLIAERLYAHLQPTIEEVKGVLPPMPCISLVSLTPQPTDAALIAKMSSCIEEQGRFEQFQKMLLAWDGYALLCAEVEKGLVLEWDVQSIRRVVSTNNWQASSTQAWAAGYTLQQSGLARKYLSSEVRQQQELLLSAWYVWLAQNCNELTFAVRLMGPHALANIWEVWVRPDRMALLEHVQQLFKVVWDDRSERKALLAAMYQGMQQIFSSPRRLQPLSRGAVTAESKFTPASATPLAQLCVQGNGIALTARPTPTAGSVTSPGFTSVSRRGRETVAPTADCCKQ